MTNDDFEESLRRNSVMLIKNDDSLMTMPQGFFKQATVLCLENRCSSIIYDIYDPHDSDYTELRITDCGYAEIVNG